VRSLSSVSRNRYCFALVLIAIFAGFQLEHYLGRSGKWRDVDINVYYVVAQVVHANPRAELYPSTIAGNPQTQFAPPDTVFARTAIAGGQPVTRLYLYPPLFADLLAPFARFSRPTVAVLWCVLNLLLVLLSDLGIARILGLHWRSARFAILVAVSFSFYPITATLAAGQIEIVLLALWTASLIAFSEGAIILSAVALALATSLKVTPALAVPLFLLWKDRRWLLTYFITLAALLAAMTAINGVPNMVGCFHFIRAMSASLPWFKNKCISAMVGSLGLGLTHRELGTPAHPTVPPLLQLTGRALAVLFYAACLALAWRQRHSTRNADRVRLFAIFILVAALTSPQTWRYGYASALIPLSILWFSAIERAVTRTRIAVLTLATAVIGTVFLEWASTLHGPFLLVWSCAAIWPAASVLLCLDALRDPSGDAQLTPPATAA
jgi:hypothetical protein